MLSNQPDLFDPEYEVRDPEPEPRPLNRAQRRTFGWASGERTPQRKLQTRRFEGIDRSGEPIGSRFTRPSLARRRRANRIANRRAGAARRVNRGR